MSDPLEPFHSFDVKEVELHAHRYATQAKTTRRAWADRARFHIGATGDDFMRNQLTGQLETLIYGEKADTSCLTLTVPIAAAGEAAYETTRAETVRAVDIPARMVFVVSFLALALAGPLWALLPAFALLAAAFVAGRWGERQVPITVAVPYSYDTEITVDTARETWAMYPDAKLPVHDPHSGLGNVVRFVEYTASARDEADA